MRARSTRRRPANLLCNVVEVTKSGTFTLYPLEEPCNGVQLLQVPTPARQFR